MTRRRKIDATIIAAAITAIATIAAAICTPLISNWIKNGDQDPDEDSVVAAKAQSAELEPSSSKPKSSAPVHASTQGNAVHAGPESPAASANVNGVSAAGALEPASEQVMAEGEPVASGSDMRFPFKGRANTPLFFRISGEGDRLRLTAAALDELEKTLTSSRTIGLGANKEGMAFTPLKDGQYILQVKALSGSGRIKVVMEEIAPPPAQRGMGRPLPLDTPKTGRLANGAYDTFTFHAEAREAMTFLYKSDPIYKCDAEMVLPDGQNKRLASFTNRTPPMSASFIAPNAGTYTLKLTATRLYGNYEITRKPMR